MTTMSEVAGAYEATRLTPSSRNFYKDGCACLVGVLVARTHGSAAARELQRLQEGGVSVVKHDGREFTEPLSLAAALLGLKEGMVINLVCGFDGIPPHEGNVTAYHFGKAARRRFLKGA